MHGNLLFEAKLLEPVLIVDPKVATPSADEGMLLQLAAAPGNAVTPRIVAAAVERPVIDAELATDQSGRHRSAVLGASQGNVGLACAEIANGLRCVELDDDFRKRFVQLAEQRGEYSDRVDLFRRNLNYA